MINLSVIAYELRRIVCTRKYLYLLIIVGIFSHSTLARLLVDGVHGTAPFSRLSYAQYLVTLNPILLSILALLWLPVFSEREMAVRRILFSAPISQPVYYFIKSSAIGTTFLLISAFPILYSFGFFGWHFGFFNFGQFINPITAFALPSALFVFGLSMAAGRISVKVLYGLIPLLFLSGVINLLLPVWVDLCANNFLLSYPKMIARTFGTLDMTYHLPIDFILSRTLLAVLGLLLYVVSCRKAKC